MPTATTVPLIILLIVLWRVTKGELLSIVLFVSIFGAASAINIAGSGVAPWIFVLVIGMCVKAIIGFPRPRLIPGCNAYAIRLLLAFICYSIWTGLAYPFIFRGVLVYSAHHLELGLLSPLSWGTANVFQIFYLLAVVVVYLIALSSSRQSLNSALRWYVRGCEVICLVAIYQLLHATVHIPYPSSVLYSNPAYVIYPAYKINDLWRLNSTLSEASGMAGYLSSGIALQAWWVFTRPFRWGSSLSLMLLVVSLLFTQSSTGYLSLIVIVMVGGVLYAQHLFRSGGMSRPILLMLIVFAICGTVVFATASAQILATREIQSVLIDKKDSSSYRERTEGNVAAVHAARETYLLGTGWGSLRCSGLGYLLIGTVGLPGLLLFTCFLTALCVPLFSRLEATRTESLYGPSLFATAVYLFGAAVAGAEPISPVLWLLFAVGSAGPGLLPQSMPHLERYQSMQRSLADRAEEIAVY